jgi:hypothetical protein
MASASAWIEIDVTRGTDETTAAVSVAALAAQSEEAAEELVVADPARRQAGTEEM